jgi:thiamine biosynthesis lipoprotein
MPAERRFHAMGSEAHVLVHGGPRDLAQRAQRRVEQLEGLWSRFQPDSEISQLNAQAGRAVLVTPETHRLVACALDGWAETDGAFDPTVLPALVALGYDAAFDRLPVLPEPGEDGEPSVAAGAGAGPSPGCGGVELFGRVPLVRLPVGVTFDPGGIGKGLAADLVSAELIDAGARGALVGVGGDLRVRGEPPDGGRWSIAVDDPTLEGRDLARFGMDDGGVATSSRLRRRWSHDGRTVHHLVDPASGEPAAGDVVAATVVAETCWRAEVVATSLIVAPHQPPPGDVLWLAVHADGRIDGSPALTERLEVRAGRR